LGRNRIHTYRCARILALAAAMTALGARPAYAAEGQGPVANTKPGQSPTVTKKRGGNEEVEWTSIGMDQSDQIGSQFSSVVQASKPVQEATVRVRPEDGSFVVSFPGSSISTFILMIPPQLNRTPRVTLLNPNSKPVTFSGPVSVVAGGWILSEDGVSIPTYFTIRDEGYEYDNPRSLREVPKVHFQLKIPPRRRGFDRVFRTGSKECELSVSFDDGQRPDDSEMREAPPRHQIGPLPCGPWVVPNFQAKVPSLELEHRGGLKDPPKGPTLREPELDFDMGSHSPGEGTDPAL
jgi:hypothetical protein